MSETMGEAHSITAEDVVSYRFPRDAEIAPSGRSAAFVYRGACKDGTPEPASEIWLADLTSGQSKRLTFGPRSDHTPRWSKDGQLAFLSDRAKAGQRQIYVMTLDGGDARPLTNLEGRIDGLLWSPDGTEIAFAFTPADAEPDRPGADAHVEDEAPHYNCLWAVNVESGALRPLTPNGYQVFEAAWSPDGKHLAVVAKQGEIAVSGWYSAQLYVVNSDPAFEEAGEMRQIFQADRQVCDIGWSPDGRQIVYQICLISDPPLWQGDVCVVEARANSTPRQITARDLPISICKLDWFEPDRMLYCARQLDGTSFGYLTVSSGQIQPLWSDYAMIMDWTVPRISTSADHKTFATVVERPNTPPQVFCGEIDKAAEAWKQVSQFEYAPLKLGRMERTSWKSVDGLEIVGNIVYPVDYEAGKRYPTVVQIHGGPTWSWLPHYAVWWEWWYQLLAGHGYVVLLPNIRGSAGRGTAYAEANFKDMGGKDWQDVLAGVDHLIEMGITDPDNLGIGGWSYGGFMTAWAISQTNRFKAAIMGAGITNWESYYAQNGIRDWQRVFYGSNPYDDPATHRQWSPLTTIKTAKTPTLILHGQEDHDVSLPQAYEMYVALKTLGVETQLVTYPRENHPILEKEHQIDLVNRVSQWFDRHLKGG
ncbi:MAG TPA: S9 family peptidase [Phototrophicaceae bacterium]|nr:S9 family peptidase [Phototrophicaceae bacterium]